MLLICRIVKYIAKIRCFLSQDPFEFLSRRTTAFSYPNPALLAGLTDANVMLYLVDIRLQWWSCVAGRLLVFGPRSRSLSMFSLMRLVPWVFQWCGTTRQTTVIKAKTWSMDSTKQEKMLVAGLLETISKVCSYLPSFVDVHVYLYHTWNFTSHI